MVPKSVCAPQCFDFKSYFFVWWESWVKVVIDAYNGMVKFYVADASDPIIATYRRIFSALFKPLDAMPPDLQKHIRYPEDLFNIQARSPAPAT